MLRRLIAWSLNNSQAVLLSAGLLLASGGFVLADMPVDVFPELNAPTVVVLTESGGLTAEAVEQQVTWPIESSMTGLTGVRRVRSASATGLSLVWVEFDWGQDIYRARQLVSEQLSMVRETLPEGTHAEIGPVTSITGEIMLLSLSSPKGTVSELEVRAYAEFELRPALMAVNGVAQVIALGGRLPEVQVHVRRDPLLLADLGIADVVEATRRAHSLRSSGYLSDVAGEERPLEQRAQALTPEDVRSTAVDWHEGVPLTLDKVASVGMGGAPRRGAAASNGHPAVIVTIKKAPGTNTLAVTAAVDAALDSLAASLPEGVVLDRRAFRQSNFIETAVSNVSDVLRDAVIIVALVLVLFLMNVRATLITLTALPLSLAAAVLAMHALGMTINVMTLGGLAVAIGALVDDAIIDVENVTRRVRLNHAAPESERRPFLQVVFEASDEIRSSVVFATVIICIVFVPLLLLGGLEGRFFRPLGFAYIVAVLASLVVALTVTPAMCRHLLRGVGAGDGRGGLLVRGLLAVYRPILAVALRFRHSVLVGTLALTIGALAVGATFGTSFLPEFNEGSFTVFITAPPGTSLTESDRLVRGIERRLTELEGVRGVTRRTGRAERDEHAEPVWSSEIDVTLDAGEDKAAVRKRIDGVLAAVQGITTTVGQPIEHRLSHILSGTPAAIAVDLFGEDLATLRAAATEVADALRAVPGTRDVAANREVRITTLPVRYDRAALARFGLTPADAAAQVGAAFDGAVVGTVRDGMRSYDLVVRLDPAERRLRRDVEDLVLRGEAGQRIRLSQVAAIAPDEAPYLVAREGGRRKAVVSCNVADGYNLGHLIAAVRKSVDPIAAQHGLQVRYGGQFEAQKSATRSLALTGGLVLMITLMLLIAALGSLRAALLVGVNLPLGLIGGIVAVFLTQPGLADNARALFGYGQYHAPVLSIASLVGFVTLFGIAIRNGILLVNHYGWLQEHEGLAPNEAVVKGSAERLIPILMTALTAVLGLLPMALAAGRPGSELLGPLAVVVLGGLTTSTFMNLVVVPAGYLVLFGRRGFSRRAPERLQAQADGSFTVARRST